MPMPLQHLAVPTPPQSAAITPRSASPARRKLADTTSRRPSHLQDVFMGVDISLNPSKKTEGRHDVFWSLAVSDGFGINSTERGLVENLDMQEGQDGVKTIVERIVQRHRLFSSKQGYKIQLVAFASTLPTCFLTQEPLLLPTIWQKLDAIPFLIPVENRDDPTAPQSPTSSFFAPTHKDAHRRKHIDMSFLPTEANPQAEGENRATRAVREAIKSLSISVRSATVVDCDGDDQEVEVDQGGRVVLCGLGDYERTTSPGLWTKFMALSKHLKQNKVSVSFFSATPQGGGVALMRHALIRLWRLVGVDVAWYCPEGHPAVFDITKRRIHNVLQGVNGPNSELKDSDKMIFEKWTETNFETFWTGKAVNSDIIVIDDPQLAALIPLIRKERPSAKIIYRSHIQIDTSLVNNPKAGNGVHAAAWDYLWSFIQKADAFLAHPVKAFVPANVLNSKMPVMFMAPSSDPLDGLNKPIGYADLKYYRQYFNRLSEQQTAVAIDFDRPYVVQVARFDPSKGIPQLAAAYLTFRQKLAALPHPPDVEDIPALVILGHGSVDDPDGQPIFEKIHGILQTEEYSWIRDDVSVVRIPPCDRTLGAILQGAWCATQLSTKEGFEVKVTEAIHKRLPMIASKAGGIPLQVKENVNGWLYDPSDREGIAECLFNLHQSTIAPLPVMAALERRQESPNSLANEIVSDIFAPLPEINPSPNKDAPQDDKVVGTSEDFWTVGNAVKWMTLWSRLSGVPIKTPEDDAVLRPLLGQQGAADIWEGMEGRDVWETVMGKKEDDLVIG